LEVRQNLSQAVSAPDPALRWPDLF
jgi:hypothetical protein